VIVGNGATCPKRTELQFYWPSSAGKEAISSSARVRFGIIWTLLKDPTMIILCVNTGLTFGAFYAMNVTFGRALEEIHDFSYVEIGICYLALGMSASYSRTLEISRTCIYNPSSQIKALTT
jgi:predicted MFS family arabinose efflux permease